MVKIISHANGVIFDTTALTGSGIAFAQKMFRPRNYPSIETVALWADRIIGTSSNGVAWCYGINESYRMSPEDLLQWCNKNKFIEI